MSDFLKTKFYDYAFKKLKGKLHRWYLNSHGGDDSSWMIPHFEKLNTLKEVIKHNHKVFDLFVNHNGRTWGHEDDVDLLNCLSNNQLLRILSDGNVPKKDYPKYLVNLRPADDYDEALQRIISLYPADDMDDKEDFVKLSKKISTMAYDLKNLLFFIRCLGDTVKDNRRREIVKELMELGYIASKYEDTDAPAYRYAFALILAGACVVAMCVGGFALLGAVVFFIPLICGKLK